MNKYIRNIGDKFRIGLVVAMCIWSTIASAATTLNGKMILRSANDPELIDMINQGKPIQYRAIQLDQPKTFNLPNEMDDGYQLYKNQRYIQLVAGSYNDLKKIKLNSKIRVTCDELYTQHSIHHFTEVLCFVKRIEVLK